MKRIMVGLAIAATASSLLTTMPAMAAKKVITAEEIQLVDSKGNKRAVLETDEKGEPAICLFSPDGSKIQIHSTSILITNKEGYQKIAIGLNEFDNFSPRIILLGKESGLNSWLDDNRLIFSEKETGNRTKVVDGRVAKEDSAKNQPSTSSSKSFHGTGASGLVGPVSLSPGIHSFSCSHAGEMNCIIDLVNQSGDLVEPLFNFIGASDRQHKCLIKKAGSYYIKVDSADGDWSMNVE